jgi:hypothetical protein
MEQSFRGGQRLLVTQPHQLEVQTGLVDQHNFGEFRQVRVPAACRVIAVPPDFPAG